MVSGSIFNNSLLIPCQVDYFSMGIWYPQRNVCRYEIEWIEMLISWILRIPSPSWVYHLLCVSYLTFSKLSFNHSSQMQMVVLSKCFLFLKQMYYLAISKRCIMRCQFSRWLINFEKQHITKCWYVIWLHWDSIATGNEFKMQKPDFIVSVFRDIHRCMHLLVQQSKWKWKSKHVYFTADH